MSATIATVGERALIARLHRRVPPPPEHVRLGIGDDAALIAPATGRQMVVTTDVLVEDIHFRRHRTPCDAIGWKALAVNLSDLASMGADPTGSLLSLVLPDDLTLDAFDQLIDGYLALARATSTPLIGGNISRSPGPLVVDVTAIGEVLGRRALRRVGARPGDALYVTGQLGAAAAGLALLEQGAARETLDADARACIERHERPEPRLKLGRIASRTGTASAAMDLSDGLADAARQLAEAAGLGVIIEAAALPCHPGAAALAAARGESAAAFALSAAEDYELAFVVPGRRTYRFEAAARRDRNVPVTRVGRFTAEPGASVEWPDGSITELPRGFAHF